MMRLTTNRCLKKLIVVGNPSEDCEALYIFQYVINQGSALLCCSELLKLNFLEYRCHSSII